MDIRTLDLNAVPDEVYIRQCPPSAIRYISRPIAWDCILQGTAAITGFVALAAVGLTFESVWTKLALVPLLTWFLLLCFNIAHEGVHGNLVRGGKEADVWNTVLATILLGFSWASSIGFSYSHLAHHRDTNVPDKDGNWWVVRRHGPAMLISVFGGAFLENYNNGLLTLRDKRYDILAAIMLYFSAATALAIWAGLTFGWVNVLVLWLLPAYLNYCAIIFFVGVVPHARSARAAVDDRFEPYEKVKFYPAWLQPFLTFFYLGHNYHNLHHVYTRVPMHHLGEVARELEVTVFNKQKMAAE